jgi:HSP20 family protein
MSQLMEPFGRGGPGVGGEFPAVNIWTGEDDAILTAELPGINPDDLEITVKNNTITLRGSRKPEDLDDKHTVIRKERGAGTFVRSFSLPFRVDADKVSAQYQKGVIQVMLARSEADKPKKITVNAG